MAISCGGQITTEAPRHGEIPVFWKTGGALSLQDTELGEQDIGAEQD